MPGRKSLPDIMGDVLNNTIPTSSKQVDKSTNQSIDLSTSQQNSENTVKITFYLPENIGSDIEDLWHLVRKSATAEDKTKVNRSLIGQELISFALNSFQDESQKKAFIDKVLKNLKTS